MRICQPDWHTWARMGPLASLPPNKPAGILQPHRAPATREPSTAHFINLFVSLSDCQLQPNATIGPADQIAGRAARHATWLRGERESTAGSLIPFAILSISGGPPHPDGAGWPAGSISQNGAQLFVGFSQTRVSIGRHHGRPLNAPDSLDRLGGLSGSLASRLPPVTAARECSKEGH